MTDAATELGREYQPEVVQPDPFAFYARAREESPVFWSEATNAWAVTRYDDVRQVLGDSETFSLTGVLRVMDVLHDEAKAELMRWFPPFPQDDEPGNEARRRARQPVQRAFTAERVRGLDTYLRERINGLADELERRGPGDLMAAFARPLPIHGKARVIGLADDDVPDVVRGGYALTVLSSAGSALSPSVQLDLARQIGPYQQLLDRYVGERHAQPRQDLISELVTAVSADGVELTPARRRSVVESMIALISAGQSTTTSMFGLAMWHLLRDPERWRAVCDDPDLIAGAVEELLRYDMPMQGLVRHATCPAAVHGVDIAAGDAVMLLFASANHDADVFAEPEEIDLRRAPNRHLSFGHGARACVGMHLARRLLQLGIGTLAERFPDLRADTNELDLWPGMHRLVRTLPVRW